MQSSSSMALVLAVLLCGCPGNKHGRAEPSGGPDPDSAEAGELLRVAEVRVDRFPPAAQRRLLRLCSEQKCPCPGEGTLSECARAGRCTRARFAVRAILRGLARE